jgi:hypothetical protein
MLIWDTNPRSPSSFSSIGLRTAEEFQFLSVPTHTTNKQTPDMNLGGQVKKLQQTKMFGYLLIAKNKMAAAHMRKYSYAHVL